MKPSLEQYSRIYQGWSKSLSPLSLARTLRLVPATVIAEYIRLDSI